MKMNTLWLYLLQAVRMGLPLVTVPYVTRVLGADGYGHFSSGLNVATYLVTLVLYGFDLTGVRSVAVASSRAARSRVYSEITAVKCLLLVLALGCGGFVVWTGLLDERASAVLVVLTPIIIGAALQQTWLFQALERSQYVLLTSLAGHALSVAAVFLFVRSPQDLLVYAACYGLAALIGGVCSAVLARGVLRLQLRWPGWAAIRSRAREGFPTFLTSFWSALLAGFGISYLTFTGAEASGVGVYAAAVRLASLLTAAYLPLSQALLPRASAAFARSTEQGYRFSRRALLISSLLWSGFGLASVLFAQPLMLFLFGTQFASGAEVLYPLVAWGVLSVVNNCLGVQTLVASGNSGVYARAFFVGLAGVLVFTPWFVSLWGVSGAAWAVAAAEFLLCAANVVAVWYVRRQWGRDK